jgi:hypothetical protein
MDRLFALFSHTSLAGQAVGVTGFVAASAMNTTNETRRIEKNFIVGDWMCVDDGEMK